MDDGVSEIVPDECIVNLLCHFAQKSFSVHFNFRALDNRVNVTNASEAGPCKLQMQILREVLQPRNKAIRLIGKSILKAIFPMTLHRDSVGTNHSLLPPHPQVSAR